MPKAIPAPSIVQAATTVQQSTRRRRSRKRKARAVPTRPPVPATCRTKPSGATGATVPMTCRRARASMLPAPTPLRRRHHRGEAARPCARAMSPASRAGRRRRSAVAGRLARSPAFLCASREQDDCPGGRGVVEPVPCPVALLPAPQQPCAIQLAQMLRHRIRRNAHRFRELFNGPATASQLLDRLHPHRKPEHPQLQRDHSASRRRQRKWRGTSLATRSGGLRYARSWRWTSLSPR